MTGPCGKTFRMSDRDEQIRAVVRERVAAVRAKDPAPLARRQSSDAVIFDVLPPLRSRGKDAVEERTRAWFDGYRSDIGYDVHELEVVADEDVAFCSFVYRVTGTLVDGQDMSMWVRATLGLRRTDGDWRIVHDHESVPWDPETGQGLIDLAPGA